MPRFSPLRFSPLLPASTVSTFAAWALLTHVTHQVALAVVPAPDKKPATVRNPATDKNSVVIFPPFVAPNPTTDAKIAGLLQHGWQTVRTPRFPDWQTAVDCFHAAIQLAQAAGDRESEADGLIGLAYVGRSTGKHTEAKELYAQAIALYHNLGNTPKEAKALFYLAECYRSYIFKGYSESAFRYYKEALVLYQQINDDKGEADTLYWMGCVHQDLGQVTAASQHYEEALPLYQKLNDLRGQGDTLYGLGWVAQTRGQIIEAQNKYQRAVRYYLQGNIARGGSRVLYDMGVLYDQLGDWNQGLQCYKKSVVECRIGTDGERALNHDVWWEMFATMGVGASYAHLGDFKQSLEYYSKASDIAYAISAFHYSKIRIAMGQIYENLGLEEQSLTYYRIAEERMPELLKDWDGNPRLDVIYGVGDIYLHLGDLLKKRGDIKGGETEYKKALECYARSAQRSHAESNALEEVHSLRAVSDIYLRLRQFAQANATYQRMLTIAKQTQQLPGEAATYYDIGNLRSRLGQYQNALTAYNQALIIQKTGANRMGAADTLRALGDVHFRQGQRAQGLALYRQALALRRTIGDQPGEADILMALATVEAKQGDTAAAARDLKVALALIEAMRNLLGNLSQIKVGFMASRLSTYSLYIDVLLRQGKSAEAFAWVEKTKARALLDLMNGGSVDLRKYLTQGEQAMLGQLRNVVAQSNQALIAAASNGATAQQVAQKREEFLNAESALQNYTDTLYAAHPELSRRQATHTLDLAGVGRFLPAHTALLNYVTVQADGIDKTLLFCVTKEGGEVQLKVYPVNQTKAQLATLTGDFWKTCRNPKADYRLPAHALYNLLLAPAAIQLKGEKHLLISPDGPLWNVQFAALLSPASEQKGGKAQFVGEQYAVTYAQSATAAHSALQERHSARRPQPSREILIMADPAFGGAARFGGATRPSKVQLNGTRAPIASGDTNPSSVLIRSRGLIITGDRTGGIRQLPGTRQEANAIWHDFPQATLRTGADAQESFFKRQAEKYRVLHLATHGLVNEAAPLYSIIVLAQPPRSKAAGTQEDGYLTARELFDMHLSADMVVLSACDTGRGQNRSGEGIIGLSWALFAAGAPSQVVSQWEVNDASTALLMGDFYAQLKQGKSKGMALQHASLQLMHDGKHAHPFYWAPFTLLGNWN